MVFLYRSIKNKDSLIYKTDEDSTYILAFEYCYNNKIKYFKILKKDLSFIHIGTIKYMKGSYKDIYSSSFECLHTSRRYMCQSLESFLRLVPRKIPLI
jgi:hypothetical protein